MYLTLNLLRQLLENFLHDSYMIAATDTKDGNQDFKNAWSEVHLLTRQLAKSINNLKKFY